MTVRSPVEFTKDTPNNRYQRVGNRVALDTDVAVEIATAIATVSGTHNLIPSSGAIISLPVSNVAVQLPALAADTTHVHISVESGFVGAPSGAVTVTFDGTAPVPADHHGLFPGLRDVWSRQTAEDAKFIRRDTTDGLVVVSQFKVP